MQDAEKFFRYIIPGLIFVIEIFLLLILSGDICIFQFITFFNNNNLAIIISIFLASGGIGFLFGIFHYTINRIPICFIDFRPFINNLKDKIILYDVQSEILLSKKIAYRIVVSLWDSNIKYSKEIQGADDRVKRMANIANSLGTIWISSIFVIIIWFYIHIFFFKKCITTYDIVLLIAGILLIVVQFFNFRIVVKDQKILMCSVLFKYFYNQEKKEKATTIFYYNK